jgi:hypothetical protein
MKGEKGVCTIGVGEQQIKRTKFDIQKHAKDCCDFYISMGFIPADYIVYKCKVCNMWHFGKLEWVKKYGK